MNLGNKIMSMTDHTNDTTHMLLIELLLHYVAVKYLTALYYCLVLFPNPLAKELHTKQKNDPTTSDHICISTVYIHPDECCTNHMLAIHQYA